MDVGIAGTLGLVYAGFTVLAAAAAVSIVRKAGYSGWWVATAVVPLANIVMLFAFAFADWPALRGARTLIPASGSASGHPGFSASGHPGFVQPAHQQAPQPAQQHPPAQPASGYPRQHEPYPQQPGYQQPGYPPPASEQPPQYHPLYPPPGTS